MEKVELRHVHRIQIENVVVALCEPQERIVTLGKAASTVQPMLKMPHDAISHLQAESGKKRGENRVQRKNGSLLDIMPDLPAETPARRQYATALGDDLGLLADVPFQPQSFLVFFADVIGGDVTTSCMDSLGIVRNKSRESPGNTTVFSPRESLRAICRC
jgi:hypothetical protein